MSASGLPASPASEVFSIPMTTRFRGITVREGMLLRGPAGWGEFSPFLDYDARVSAPWLRCAREAADIGWPEPVRDRVPVNVIVPAVGPEQAAALPVRVPALLDGRRFKGFRELRHEGRG